MTGKFYKDKQLGCDFIFYFFMRMTHHSSFQMIFYELCEITDAVSSGLMHLNHQHFCIVFVFLHLMHIHVYMCYVRFSAEGTPYSIDSAGIVRMISSGFSNTWVEVANLRQHVSRSAVL